MSKLVFSGDALADASVLGAFLLNAKNARRDTVDGRAERDAGGGGGGGGHLSAESTASSASSSAQTSTKWVSGARRRMVRRPNLPFVPRRRTVEEKAVFRKWLEDEEVVMQTGLHNDCGCALHSRGCFHALIFALIERDLLAAVLRKRNVRFATSFEKLAPMKIKELYHAIRRDESAPYFEFSVLQVPVLLRSLKGDQGSWV